MVDDGKNGRLDYRGGAVVLGLLCLFAGLPRFAIGAFFAGEGATCYEWECSFDNAFAVMGFGGGAVAVIVGPVLIRAGRYRKSSPLR